MAGATATGTTELSTGAWSLAGTLLINGVPVPLRTENTAGVVKTINRFTSLTGVTAAEKDKHITLTSDDDINVDGDTNVVGALGVGGVTEASTASAPAAATATATTAPSS